MFERLGLGFMNLMKGQLRVKSFGKAFVKREPLTPKRGNRLYYKGTGGRTEGKHTQHGHYIVDPDKLMKLQVPDLTGFKLKPYVANTTPKIK